MAKGTIQKVNILHFGCSWSEYFPNDGEDTVPTHTSRLLKEQGIDHKYYVAAKGGGSLEEQCNLMFSAFEVFDKIDFVVFQLSSVRRGYIPLSEPNIRPDSAEQIKNIYCWPHHRKASLMYAGRKENKSGLIIQWKSTGTISGKLRRRMYEQYINMMPSIEKNKPHFRHVSYITFIKNFLTTKKIPHVIYTHQWDPELNIYKDITDPIVKFEVVEYFGGWDSCIEQYGDADRTHLNSEGNRRIAEELLFPRIIKQIL